MGILGLACLVLGSAQVDPVQFDYASFRGLRIKVGDTAVVESSGFQFYEPGWKQGYFSSAWKPLDVVRQASGSTLVRIQGDNGRVVGTILLKPQDSGIDLTYDLVWHGNKPARIEVAVARIWAPLVAEGSLVQDGNAVPFLNLLPGSQSTTPERALGRPANQVVFDAPSAKVTFSSETPIQCLDARNSQAEWAKGKDLFWVGFTDVVANPGQPVRFRVTAKVEPVARPVVRPSVEWAASAPLPAAFQAGSKPFPIVPKPKSESLGGGFLDCGTGFRAPGAAQREVTWLHGFLARHWEWEPSAEPSVPVTLTSDASLPREGYELVTSPSGVTVKAPDEAGFRHAFRTMALIARPVGGRLSLPLGRIRDWPSLSWRGVHSFVGPDALRFQSRLIDDVLTVAKANRIVLECSRTSWDATPGIQTSASMSKADLVALVAKYRESGIEPIPLVQSLGHMEWLFANGQNLGLAVNPAIPYTLDPRKVAGRELVAAVWREALDVFKPTTVHFGLDEIDNRGLPDEPHFATRMWAVQLPFLMQLAKSAKVRPMVWSDMMLHKSEAPDAAGAESLEIARQRRSVLPRGTLVGDWHYKSDPKPETFKSMALWKNLGMDPVATSWNRPANIRGQALAAKAVGGGHLQTTWAGYESNEENMVRNFDQFSAYLIAADYAWSGREDMPDRLGYEPGALLRRLFFAPRSPLVSMPGSTYAKVVPTRFITVGQAMFAQSAPLQLFGLTTSSAYVAPDSLVVRFSRPTTKVAIALDCIARVTEGEAVATVEAALVSGGKRVQRIAYGTHVRAVSDPAPTLAGERAGSVSAVTIDFGREEATAITVRVAGSSAGVRIHGVTTR